MKPEDFQKLVEKLGVLTPEQRSALLKALVETGEAEATKAVIESRFVDRAVCPHCQGDSQKWGTSAGLQRYRCRVCAVTFNAATGTPLAWLKKRNLLTAYGQTMVDGLSLRKSAAACRIHLTTAFDWRHRLLKMPALSRPDALEGVVEADETYVLESQKGSRHLCRPARRRGGVATKRGLSNEQIPIMVARDRSGATHTEVLPEVTTASITASLDDLCAKDAALVSDGARVYRAFANATGRLHVALTVSKGRYVWGTYHIQNVNAYTSRWKGWMARFRGVATAYLPNYLGWHRKLDRDGTAFTKMSPIAAALA
jgi:transposase-like protein